MSEIIKTTAIVLNSSPCSVDAARDLELFSPSLGKFFARARGVEKPKAKLAAATQPFCFGEFSLAERAGRYTVTDVYVQDTFFKLAYNLDSFVMGSALLEITSKLAQTGEENLELFKLLLNCLKVMVYENANPSAVFIRFVIESLMISGLGLDFCKCSNCGKVLDDEKHTSLIYDGQGVLCENCSGRTESVKLSSAEWETLQKIALCDFNELSVVCDYNREVFVALMKLMIKQFYFRTGEKIKSLDKYF